MQYDLIIFDMDGVLVDACELHRASFDEALCEVLGFKLTDKEHYSHFNGIPTKKKIEKLETFKQIKIKKKEREKIFRLKQEKTLELIDTTITHNEQLTTKLKMLLNKGYHLACYTNSIRESTTAMLKKAGIFDLLDLIVTNEDVTNPKPDPEGYLTIIDRYEVEPSRVLIFEDSPVGLEAAKATKASVCFVADTKDLPNLIDSIFFRKENR